MIYIVRNKVSNIWSCFGAGTSRYQNISLQFQFRLSAGPEIKSTKLNKVQLSDNSETFRRVTPSHQDENYNATSYYFENGLRKVYPYYYDYTTFTKERWIGKPILEVFAKEFVLESIEMYEHRIREGLLTVNNERVSTDYCLKNNDFISHCIHRHELPVINENIGILYEDKDLLVVNKPSSIPVHPSGRYRHNSILFILAKEFNLKDLLPVHRLDRLTSGLLIFGRNREKASCLQKQFFNHEIQKEYLCRVEGEFPSEIIVCKEHIKPLNRSLGIYTVSSTGKKCTTVFKRLGYNGKTSIISCRPLTGRTHQIRVHLQYLGFPVVRDSLYNHTVFGPEKGKGGKTGKSEDQLVEDIMQIKMQELIIPKSQSVSSLYINQNDEKLKESGYHIANGNVKENISNVNSVESIHYKNSHINKNQDESIYQQPSVVHSKINRDKNCIYCKMQFRDPKPSDLFMCLHAWKYVGPEWSYETQLPFWAEEVWEDDIL